MECFDLRCHANDGAAAAMRCGAVSKLSAGAGAATRERSDLSEGLEAEIRKADGMVSAEVVLMVLMELIQRPTFRTGSQQLEFWAGGGPGRM